MLHHKNTEIGTTWETKEEEEEIGKDVNSIDSYTWILGFYTFSPSSLQKYGKENERERKKRRKRKQKHFVYLFSLIGLV